MVLTEEKIAPDVCGVGWVVECSVSGEQLEDYFYEITDNANAYCAKQLELDAIHHVLAALSIYCDVDAWNTRAGCDNEGAINISREGLEESGQV